MKKNITSKITCAAILILAGFVARIGLADTEIIPFTVKSVSGSGCPGAYSGYAKMTNGTGTFWITPPTGTTNGTLTDASGFPSPYVSVVKVVRSPDQVSWCDTNSINFPVTNGYLYSLTVYVKSPVPPPTNGEPMNVQITWH